MDTLTHWWVVGKYCWWFRNPVNQLRLVVYPIVYRVSYIPGGDRRISEPSTAFQFQTFPAATAIIGAHPIRRRRKESMNLARRSFQLPSCRWKWCFWKSVKSVRNDWGNRTLSSKYTRKNVPCSSFFYLTMLPKRQSFEVAYPEIQGITRTTYSDEI